MNLVDGAEVLALSEPKAPLIEGDIEVYRLVNGSSFKNSLDWSASPNLLFIKVLA